MMDLTKAARRLQGAFRGEVIGRIRALGGWKAIPRMMEAQGEVEIAVVLPHATRRRVVV
jgi:hypothetical protein